MFYFAHVHGWQGHDISRTRRRRMPRRPRPSIKAEGLLRLDPRGASSSASVVIQKYWRVEQKVGKLAGKLPIFPRMATRCDSTILPLRTRVANQQVFTGLVKESLGFLRGRLWARRDCGSWKARKLEGKRNPDSDFLSKKGIKSSGPMAMWLLGSAHGDQMQVTLVAVYKRPRLSPDRHPRVVFLYDCLTS